MSDEIKGLLFKLFAAMSACKCGELKAEINESIRRNGGSLKLSAPVILEYLAEFELAAKS